MDIPVRRIRRTSSTEKYIPTNTGWNILPSELQERILSHAATPAVSQAAVSHKLTEMSRRILERKKESTDIWDAIYSDDAPLLNLILKNKEIIDDPVRVKYILTGLLTKSPSSLQCLSFLVDLLLTLGENMGQITTLILSGDKTDDLYAFNFFLNEYNVYLPEVILLITDMKNRRDNIFRVLLNEGIITENDIIKSIEIYGESKYLLQLLEKIPLSLAVKLSEKTLQENWKYIDWNDSFEKVILLIYRLTTIQNFGLALELIQSALENYKKATGQEVYFGNWFIRLVEISSRLQQKEDIENRLISIFDELSVSEQDIAKLNLFPNFGSIVKFYQK